MTLSTAPTGLGLLAAASWGGSDFVGGIGSRRAPALLVTAAGQVASLAALAVVCAAVHEAVPARNPMVLSAVAGCDAALALALFYRALAMGAMGLTAALTGLVTALVPVVYSAVRYGLPAPLTAVGLAVGLVSIWLITHNLKDSSPPLALLLGVLAGAGFGIQLVLFRIAEGGPGEPAGAGGLAVMTVSRLTGAATLLAVVAVTRTRAPGGLYWLAGGVSGLLDAAGNLLFLAAARMGRLDAAAVVCSLYPAGTILLAAMLLRERPTARQVAGMGLALVAVALLSL